MNWFRGLFISEESVFMWTVVYLAQSSEVASKLEDILKKEGILVKQRPVSRSKDKDNYYEIIVPESEVEEAHNIIIEQGF
jgi:galactitol-specific phosphotransferase system IIB component